MQLDVWTANSIDTLIVSDIHLGSRVSRDRELVRLLKRYRVSKYQYRFNRLILLGDVFDDLNFKRLKKHAWELVGLFRQITNKKCNAEVVWLLGNHDLELAELMTHLVGIPTHREYEWTTNGKRFLAMHGDQFDRWIINFPNLVEIPCWIYSLIQRLDGPEQRVSRFVKEKSKLWLRINDEVAQGILTHALKKDKTYNTLFCGHTHIAESIDFPEHDIRYVNTGCWTGKQDPTYVTIDHSGHVALHEYVEPRPAILPVAEVSVA